MARQGSKSVRSYTFTTFWRGQLGLIFDTSSRNLVVIAAPDGITYGTRQEPHIGITVQDASDNTYRRVEK